MQMRREQPCLQQAVADGDEGRMFGVKSLGLIPLLGSFILLAAGALVSTGALAAEFACHWQGKTSQAQCDQVEAT